MKSRINTLFKLYIVDTTNHTIEKKKHNNQIYRQDQEDHDFEDLTGQMVNDYSFYISKIRNRK